MYACDIRLLLLLGSAVDEQQHAGKRGQCFIFDFHTITHLFNLCFDQRPRDDKRERFDAFIDRCGEGTRGVLDKLFNDNGILDGIEGFGEDGNNEGFNNGLFSCFIRKPAASASRGSGREWKCWSQNVFIACMNAGIPFVLKGDAPNASPIGNMMKAAQDEHATRLGQIGRKSGTGLFPLNEEFTDKWRTGDVGPLELLNTLNGGTLTIDNTEVRRHIHLALYIRMYVLFLHARIVNRCKLKIGPTAGGIVFLCISRVHSFPKQREIDE